MTTRHEVRPETTAALGVRMVVIGAATDVSVVVVVVEVLTFITSTAPTPDATTTLNSAALVPMRSAGVRASERNRVAA